MGLTRKKRVAVGFYKDEKDKTRPITKSTAELNRKKVIQNPKKFRGVSPKFTRKDYIRSWRFNPSKPFVLVIPDKLERYFPTLDKAWKEWLKLKPSQKKVAKVFDTTTGPRGREIHLDSFKVLWRTGWAWDHGYTLRSSKKFTQEFIRRLEKAGLPFIVTLHDGEGKDVWVYTHRSYPVSAKAAKQILLDTPENLLKEDPRRVPKAKTSMIPGPKSGGWRMKAKNKKKKRKSPASLSGYKSYRVFDGKRYSRYWAYEKKPQAEKIAKEFRDEGFLVRIKKTKAGYEVFRRKK